MDNTNNTPTTAFGAFLRSLETLEDLPTSDIATGSRIIQQSTRNDLRRQGLNALLSDLNALYGDAFSVLQTKDGIVLVAENEPNDVTIS